MLQNIIAPATFWDNLHVPVKCSTVTQNLSVFNSYQVPGTTVPVKCSTVTQNIIVPVTFCVIGVCADLHVPVVTVAQNVQQLHKI